jgi:hypothetical protein
MAMRRAGRLFPDPVFHIIQVLGDVDADASLVEVHEHPEGHYVLRLAVPGEVGKTLRLPRRLVERAPRNRWAGQILRRILQSEVLILRAQRGISESRALRVATFRDPACPVCHLAVPADEPLFLHEGRIVHVRCFARRSVPPPGGAA